MRGPEDLIQELLARRSDLIAYLRSIGPAELAEDVFQETFLVVQRKLADYEERGTFFSWVRVIARQVMYQALARNDRLKSVPQDRLHQLIEVTVEEHLDGDVVVEHVDALRRCLQQLEPAQRRLLDLRYAVGRSLAEIARELRRTEGAVQVALSRLRGALAVCIDRQRKQP